MRPIIVLVALLTALAAATAPVRAYKPRILQIGFVPSENSTQMAQKVAPLLTDLSKVLGMKVVSFVATDYPGVVEAMRNKKVDAAFLAPLPFVMAEQRAQARLLLKAVRHGRHWFYSAIIVRRDSGIRQLRQLKGRRFAFGDPFSMAGTIFPQALLRDNGIEPKRDLTQLPPGGHDMTVLAVYNRHADAGAVFANDPEGKEGAWSFFLKTPEEREQIMPIAISKPIPNDTFCTRADLDEELSVRVKQALIQISKTQAGKRNLYSIYHIDGFTDADSTDYDSVRQAVKLLGKMIP